MNSMMSIFSLCTCVLFVVNASPGEYFQWLSHSHLSHYPDLEWGGRLYVLRRCHIYMKTINRWEALFGPQSTNSIRIRISFSTLIIAKHSPAPKLPERISLETIQIMVLTRGYAIFRGYSVIVVDKEYGNFVLPPLPIIKTVLSMCN